METHRPGATVPAAPLAALVTALMVGVPVPVPEPTVKVTITVSAAPEPLVGVTVMLPRKVPASMPAGLGEIESEAGVVPDAGVTVSHLALETAVKPVGDPAATDTVCATGVGPATGAAKESCVGVTVNGPVPNTVSVTGIEIGPAAPEAVAVMLPVYVPAPRPVGLAVTSTLAGVVPLTGDNVSQAPGDVTVKVSGVAPLASA